jgi:hypothetical protein
MLKQIKLSSGIGTALYTVLALMEGKLGIQKPKWTWAEGEDFFSSIEADEVSEYPDPSNVVCRNVYFYIDSLKVATIFISSNDTRGKIHWIAERIDFLTSTENEETIEYEVTQKDIESELAYGWNSPTT